MGLCSLYVDGFITSGFPNAVGIEERASRTTAGCPSNCIL